MVRLVYDVRIARTEKHSVEVHAPVGYGNFPERGVGV
jgi:hypothetical protein